MVWLSQTTLSVDETMETVGALRERVPGLVSPPSDDICYATQNRQTAVKKVAPRSDVLIVVGSANSSNSVRLLEVGLQHGAKSGHRVDHGHRAGAGAGSRAPRPSGVTSGASVPEILVRDVLVRLAELGFDDVEDVDAVEEHMVFALPAGAAPRPEGRREAVVVARAGCGRARQRSVKWRIAAIVVDRIVAATTQMAFGPRVWTIITASRVRQRSAGPGHEQLPGDQDRGQERQRRHHRGQRAIARRA